MIRYRTKMEPGVVRTASDQREILDLERWGLILEILSDEPHESEPVDNTTDKPEKVEGPRDRKSKASSGRKTEDEQE